MRSWASEFKQFLLRGNVIDLAVAFVIGAAFAALVQAAVTDLLTPLVAAIFGQPDFSIDARRCAYCTSEVAAI